MAKLNKTPLTLRLKRGTAAQITATNPAPFQKEGEMAYATDTGGFYISDGTQFILLANGLQDLQSVTDINNVTTNAIDTAGTKSDYFLLDTAATPTLEQGMLFWDADRSTAGLQMNGVEARLGQDNFWYVKNQSGSDILKGTAVMTVGALGASGRILIAPMVADGSVEELYLLGVTAEDILDGEDGFVMNIGKIRGIDTTQYGTQAGQVLYCDPANPGGFTITQPDAPNLDIPIAFTVDYKSNGTIAVRVNPGYHIGELHDVYSNSPSNNDILLYNSTNSRWENTPISTAVPTPTLDEVTTEGNTTTNEIVAGGLTVDTDLLYTDTVNKRVGIGTTTPGFALEISSPLATNVFGTVRATNANATAAWVGFNDQNDNVVYRVFGSGSGGSQMGIPLARSSSLMANMGGSGSFLLGTYSSSNFVLGTANQERMRIFANGNIAIGTTTDAGYKLDVSGTVNANDFSAGGLAGYTGTITIDQSFSGLPPINIEVNGGIITNVT